MRFRHAFLVAAIMMLLAAARPIFAQGAGSAASTVSLSAASPATATDKLQDSIVLQKRVCRVWSVPSETSKFPRDASYNACALDKTPVLVSSAAMPGAPRINRAVTANFVIVVNADGSVNRELTSFGGGLLHVEYLNAIQDSMSHWRFTPGMRGGIAVRSARSLRIESTGVRVDTITASIDWTYRANAGTDTLSGRWVVRAPLPQLTAAQTDSMYMTFLYLLAVKRVMVANTFSRLQYCLVVQNGDSAAQVRITNRARYMGVNGRQYDPGIDTPPPFYFAGYGCERTAEPLRIILPPIRRSEEGKVVFETGGDFLPNYPLNANGRSWRGWKARCNGAIPERMPITLDCEIGVGEPYIEWSNWYRDEQQNRARALQNARTSRPGGDSTWITALVATDGGTQRDTLRATFASIPMITERAVNDTLAPCGSSAAFTSQSDSADVWVIHGNPYRYLNAGGMQITLAKRTSAPQTQRERTCFPEKAHMAKFAAFIAGGMGGKATAPVTLQFSNEKDPYIIDPAKHTIAQQPHLTFRISDLKAETRNGKNLHIILRVGPERPSMIPVIVFPDANPARRYQAVLGESVSGDRWEARSGSFPPDGVVYVYFFRYP